MENAKSKELKRGRRCWHLLEHTLQWFVPRLNEHKERERKARVTAKLYKALSAVVGNFRWPSRTGKHNNSRERSSSFLLVSCCYCFSALCAWFNIVWQNLRSSSLFWGWFESCLHSAAKHCCCCCLCCCCTERCASLAVLIGGVRGLWRGSRVVIIEWY